MKSYLLHLYDDVNFCRQNEKVKPRHFHDLLLTMHPQHKRSEINDIGLLSIILCGGGRLSFVYRSCEIVFL